MTAQPSAVPSYVAALARWLITLAGAALVAHGVLTGAQAAQMAGPLLAVAPLVWSMIQKRGANKALRVAIAAPAVTTPLKPTKGTMMPNYKDLIAAFMAALPPETTADTRKLVTDVLAGVEAAADQAVAVAEAKLPATLQPLAEVIASAIDAQVAKLTAARASLTPTAGA